jgi:acetoin utilization deacetylase AcuC-like enzyme
MKTWILVDQRSADHTVPRGFPECPERVLWTEPALRDRRWNVEGAELRSADGLPAADVRHAAERVHDAQYIERFEAAVQAAERSIDTADNPLSAGTSAAAWGAVAAALRACRLVQSEKSGHAFSLTRPPGHHCERDRAMGFCYFNQIAIAAQFLIDSCEAERVAIVDFDVHHGNGTQHLFEDRADVFYLSLHQAPFYPGTGAAREVGVGAGRGTTLNLPLPAGTDDTEFLEVLDTRALPALQQFAPDALLASAGFDGWQNDPLGGMALSRQLFWEVGRRLAEFADRQCAGRLVSVLEGGYDLQALPGLIDSYLRGAAGVRYSEDQVGMDFDSTKGGHG